MAHHPDFYDASPLKQDISVYYGDMVYGNVSFAILGDCQFKSGPEHVETGDRPAHGLPQTGEYKDGFENMAYVYAVGYPEHESLQNRYDIAHQKGSGFGFINVDTAKESYYIDSYRFSVDVNDAPQSTQFEGWTMMLTLSGEVIPRAI